MVRGMSGHDVESRQLLELPVNIAEALKFMAPSQAKGSGPTLGSLLTPEERHRTKMRKLDEQEAKIRERRRKENEAMERLLNP